MKSKVWIGVVNNMQLIDDESQIAVAQEKFENILKNGAKKYRRVLGYQGENTGLIDVFWIEPLDIWVAFQTLDNRYWNAFGIGEPIEKNLSIVCEINSPLKGIDRRISGAYAKDKDGSVFVLHNGRIGGGKPGVGKSLFLNNYRGKLIDIGGNNYAVIGKLGDTALKAGVANFVKEIHRIKNTL